MNAVTNEALWVKLLAIEQKLDVLKTEEHLEEKKKEIVYPTEVVKNLITELGTYQIDEINKNTVVYLKELYGKIEQSRKSITTELSVWLHTLRHEHEAFELKLTLLTAKTLPPRKIRIWRFEVLLSTVVCVTLSFLLFIALIGVDYQKNRRDMWKELAYKQQVVIEQLQEQIKEQETKVVAPKKKK